MVETNTGYARISIDEIVHRVTQNKEVRDLVDNIFVRSGMGKVTTIRDKQYNGFNHRSTAVNLPPIRDHQGYCFFVRPMLNLSKINSMRVRQLAQLITKNELSVQRWARLTLDYKLEREENLTSPLVDNLNPFIPLLSNSLKSLTGVPSLVAGTHTSERGLAKEVFTMIDDNVINYDAYTVTTSFRTMNGNPHLILFYSWILAASMQYLGKIAPRWPDRMQKRLNYTTRIYRITLDHTKTYVTNIWAPIYCFPTTIETGSIFKYDIEKPINDELDSFDVQFQCAGSVFNDDLLIQQFNTLVMMGNNQMTDSARKGMVKLQPHETNVLNYYGYPRINPATNEMEWWVDRNIYQNALETIKKSKEIGTTFDERLLYAKNGLHGDAENRQTLVNESSQGETTPGGFSKGLI